MAREGTKREIHKEETRKREREREIAREATKEKKERAGRRRSEKRSGGGTWWCARARFSPRRSCMPIVVSDGGSGGDFVV